MATKTVVKERKYGKTLVAKQLIVEKTDAQINSLQQGERHDERGSLRFNRKSK